MDYISPYTGFPVKLSRNGRFTTIIICPQGCCVLFLLLPLQLGNLTYEELQQRMSALDPEMEREIEDLRKRYQAKRQPILDAIDAKKKRQQNF